MFKFIKNLFKTENKDTVTIDPSIYESLSKNQLVKELWSRNINHNKRQLKSELIDLLIENDKKNFK